MEVIDFFGIIALCLLFTKYFHPIQEEKRKIIVWSTRKVVWLGLRWKPLFHLTGVVSLLYCAKCLTFWTLLVITHSLSLAAIGAIIAMVVDYILEKTQNNTLIK